MAFFLQYPPAHFPRFYPEPDSNSSTTEEPTEDTAEVNPLGEANPLTDNSHLNFTNNTSIDYLVPDETAASSTSRAGRVVPTPIIAAVAELMASLRRAATWPGRRPWQVSTKIPSVPYSPGKPKGKMRQVTKEDRKESASSMTSQQPSGARSELPRWNPDWTVVRAMEKAERRRETEADADILRTQEKGFRNYLEMVKTRNPLMRLFLDPPRYNVYEWLLRYFSDKDDETDEGLDVEEEEEEGTGRME